VRVCIVYDCLYPYTVGGAERWYRNLAERLAVAGDEVTYLTRRQWRRGDGPQIAGVRVVAVSPRVGLYVRGGRRRIWHPVLFGLGVFAHLLRHGARYDVVHTASFPYFSLLGAGAVRRRFGFRLMVDWHEFWTRRYWRAYLGPLRGRIGWEIQQACLRVPQHAFCFSRLHQRRLREAGLENVTLLEGQYAGPLEASVPEPTEPVMIFAGRHIPEKRAPVVVSAFVRARKRIPELRCEIYGDGPERSEVLRLIAEEGLEGSVTAPGFVERERIERALGRALCLVLPSRREGYGLVVVEAAAQGVPSVVVDDPDNAAVELVQEGVNGAVARSADPDELADAIVRVYEAGPALRAATAEWFERNAERLSLGRSLEIVASAYGDA
jgi:glycosyltransferase involved in cell wall biosynthesis